MGISFGHEGNFDKTEKWFNETLKTINNMNLDKYGQLGVQALMSATPIDTGLAASSWYYDIEKKNGSSAIRFYNSDIENGINVAVILQYGHATKNGGWVEGRDYINPAIRPVFDQIVKDAWKEVTG